MKPAICYTNSPEVFELTYIAFPRNELSAVLFWVWI